MSQYQLMIDMAANVAKLKTDMDDAKRAVEGTTGRINSALDGMKGMFASIAATVGVGAVVTYFKGITLGAIQAADNMGDLATKVGVSATFLSQYKLAADTSGASLETLAGGMQKLSKNLVEAQEGTDIQVQAFKRLGIEIFDSSGKLKTAETVFLEMADKMRGIKDPAEQVKIAMELLGKSGAELIPTLMNGSDGLERMKNMSEALGLVFSEEMLGASDRVNDNFVILGKMSEGLGNQIATRVLPTLEGLTGWLLEAATSSNLMKDAADVITNVFKGMVAAGAAVIGTLKALWEIGTTAFKALAQAASGDFKGAWETLKKGGSDTVNVIMDTVKWIDKMVLNELPKMDSQSRAVAAAIGQLGQQNAKTAAAADKLAESAKKQVEQFKGMTDAANRQIEGFGKLTKAEEAYLKVLKDISEGRAKYTPRQIEAIALAADEAIKAEKNAEMTELVRKAIEEGTKARDAAITKQKDRVTSLDEEIKKEEAALKAIGLSKDEVQRLELAKYDEAIASAARQEQLALESGLDGELAQLYSDEIKRLERLKELKGAQIIAQAHVDAATKAKDEWSKMLDNVSASLTDALVRGFDSGRGFFDNLVQYIKNAFKTMAVKLVIEPTVKSLVGSLGSGLVSMLAPQGASAAGGGGDALDIASMGTSLWSALSSSGLAYGATGLMATLTGTGLGTSLGAAGSLMMGGNIAGGATMGLGAIAPYALAAYAVYRIISGKGTGRDRTPAINYSALGSIGDAGFTAMPFDPNYAGNPGGGALAGELAEDFVKGVGSALYATVKLFGGTIKDVVLGASYGVSKERTESGRITMDVGTQRVLELRADSSLEGVYGPGQDGRQSVQEWLATNVPIVRLAGLQAADLSKPFEDYFAQFDISTITKEEADAALLVASAARQMELNFSGVHGVFSQLSAVSVDARTNILALTGGLEAFTAKAAKYIDLYYNENEKAGIGAKMLADQLRAAGVDITGLDTKEEYRALLDKLDKNALETPEGQKQLAALLDNAEAFASLSEYLKANNVTLEDLAAMAESDPMLTLIAEKQTQAAEAAETQATNTTTIAESSTATKEAVEQSKDVLVAVRELLAQLIAAANAGHSGTQEAVRRAGNEVAGAVTQLASRPIEVTVKASEVNGGAV